MRILQVNKLYEPWVGGIEQVARDIAEGLHGKDGIEVTTLVCDPYGPRIEETVNGVPVIRAASFGMVKRMPISLDFLLLFRKLSKRADVIILHHPFPLGFLAYWLFGRGKRCIVWYHSDIVRQKRLNALFRPLCVSVLNRAERIFVASHGLVLHSKMLQLFADKCVVIPFGIDAESYKETPEVLKKANRLRMRAKHPFVLAVGRLVYYKGFAHLIEAMKDVSDVVLVLVGTGPEKKRLQKQVKQAGLKKRVHFVPHQKDLVPYFHGADVFALPSTEPSEAFGIVQLEALASGTPVVNTHLPTGVPEVSPHGVTGLTVPPKDPKALADALNTLLSDVSLRKKYGAAAVARVKELYTKDKMIESIKKELC